MKTLREASYLWKNKKHWSRYLALMRQYKQVAEAVAAVPLDVELQKP